MLKVEIDGNSGFCGGVIRAIGKAEAFLEDGGKRLFSLGAIVHNEAELSRLREKGLATVNRDELPALSNQGKATVLIRAHGQAPNDYNELSSLGFNIIDCTCPVVLKIQKSIREAYGRLQSKPKPGRIVIFGKHGHAEVLGLAGQVNGDVIICETVEELNSAIDNGTLDISRDIEIFSQTTMNPVSYDGLCDSLKSRMSEGAALTVHRTICAQVESRHEQLAAFAAAHDIIIFVSGRSSSNGKVLYELCRSANARTHHISDIKEIDKAWFKDSDSVGVCGATSTPKWQLEEVARAVENLQ